MGFVETDYFGVYGYMTADQGVRNGSDLMLCTTGNDYNNVTVLTNSAKQAMRESAKNILYTVGNSGYYVDPTAIVEEEGVDNMTRLFTTVNVSVCAAAAVIELIVVVRWLLKKKKAAKKAA